MPRRRGVVVTALALHALAQGAAHAQVVYGRVIDDVERTPLPATVTLRAAADASVQLSVVANDSGGFRMVVPRPGEYVVEASLPGYATLAPARVSVAAGEGVQIEVRLARDAIALEPLIVVARRSDVAQDATFEGALARHAAFPSQGTRRVVLRSDPEFTAARSLQDVAHWLPRQRSCVYYFWNGRRMVVDEARDVMDESVNNFEAVEFYRTMVDAPLGLREQLVGTPNPSCTVVAVWPRQGARPELKRLPVLRLVAVLAAVVLVVLVVR